MVNNEGGHWGNSNLKNFKQHGRLYRLKYFEEKAAKMKTLIQTTHTIMTILYLKCLFERIQNKTGKLPGSYLKAIFLAILNTE